MKLILENQSTKYSAKDTEYQLFVRQRGKPATYELLMRKNGCMFARNINIFKSKKSLRAVLQAIEQEQIKLDALWNMCETNNKKGGDADEIDGCPKCPYERKNSEDGIAHCRQMYLDALKLLNDYEQRIAQLESELSRYQSCGDLRIKINDDVSKATAFDILQGLFVMAKEQGKHPIQTPVNWVGNVKELANKYEVEVVE